MRNQFLAFLLLFAPSAILAQTIQGTVVEAMSGTVVGTGFVVLLGPDGKEIGRALSDLGGRFSIKAPAPGQYRLRSERIGFKVQTSPSFTLTEGETLQYRLEIVAIPIRLEEIVVERETRCRVRPEGRATATVWDEARKALAAVSWVQNQQRIRLQLRTYERDLDPTLRVVREKSTTKAGTANRAFRAVPPGQLASRGYVEPSPDGGYVFQAPDADVLFSDEFLNGHCFRLAPDEPSKAGQIGLVFEPVGDRKLPDIAGTLWVDEKSAELRNVEFRYLRHGLEVESDLIGGRVEFERLANGGWLVSRFWIRMPILIRVEETRYSSGTAILRGGARRETRIELAGLREEGGEVLVAYGTDGTRLTESVGATVSGTMIDGGSNAPVIGAQVRLTGTPFSTTTGPGGAFELTGLPEGNYSLEFTHNDYPSWGWLAGPLLTTQRNAAVQVTLTVPAARDLIQHICPALRPEEEAAAAGVVKDSATALPVRDAVVLFTWKDYRDVGAQAINARNMEAEVGTDSTGYFRACKLPLNVPVTARVMNGEKEGPSIIFKPVVDSLGELTLLRGSGR